MKRELSSILQETDKSKMKSVFENVRNLMKNDTKIAQVPCFTLYSILLAVNRTDINYFSLDIVENELDVLSTIPWHKVDIKVLHIQFQM